MYRKKDTYLVNDTLDLKDSSSACRAINDKFSVDGAGFLFESAPLQNSVLFFAYMCQYITYDELSTFLGKFYSNSAVRIGVSQLVDKKLLRREKFKSTEGLAKYAFCLTKKGVDNVLPLLPYHLSHNIKTRYSGGMVPLHDYYCGINMMHFFVSPLQFLWEKEVVYSNKLRPDIILSVKDKGIVPRIFIEQDMGTEDHWKLLNKLNKYNELELTANSIVIFSMATKLTAPAANSGLSRAFVTELKNLMESCRINSVFELYERYLRRDDEVIGAAVALKDQERFVQQLEEFMVWTGVCRSIGLPVSAMSCNNLNRYLNHDFTLQEVSRYLEDLKNQSNPYIRIYLNKANHVYSFFKYLGLLKIVLGHTRKASWTNVPYVGLLLGGYQVFVVPTNLLSNYFPYMFVDMYGTLSKYVTSLNAYYPSMDAKQFKPSTERFFIRPNFPSISFKNSFSLDGGLVVVASVYDMSALTQIALLYNINYCDAEPYKFIHSVLLVDEFEQAVRIQQLLQADTYANEHNYFPPADNFLSCAYLLCRDCGKKERLFGIYEYTSFGESEYEPVYLYPAQYKDSEDGQSIISERQRTHFYDIPGYGDVECSLREDIEDELDL